MFPHVPNYWQEVAKRVPGKTAEQCQAQLNANDIGGSSPHRAAKATRPAPPAASGAKRKAAPAASSKDAKRARAEQDDGHTSEDDFQTKTKPKPKAGAAGAAQASSDTSSSEEDEDDDENDAAGAAPDGQQAGSSKAPVRITAHKGTIKRRRQLRELLQQVRCRRRYRRARVERTAHEAAGLPCDGMAGAQRSPRHQDRFEASPGAPPLPGASPLDPTRTAPAEGAAVAAGVPQRKMITVRRRRAHGRALPRAAVLTLAAAASPPTPRRPSPPRKRRAPRGRSTGRCSRHPRWPTARRWA